METLVGNQRESTSSIRGQHKRIFGASRPNSGARSAIELPQCLFHCDERITKFCECQEHKKQGTHPQLNSYANSREKASQDLQTYVKSCRQGRDSIMGVLLAQKNQIEQTVNTFFEEFVAKVEAMTLTEDRLYDLERRQQKIAKGSVKAVIQHYAETYPVVRFPKISISFSAAALDSVLQNFTFILPEGEVVTTRPASSYEARQSVQHVRSQQAFKPAGDLQTHIPDIHKQLVYSPKPQVIPTQVGIRPFAHIEQQAFSPHTVQLVQTQEHTTPVHASTSLEPRQAPATPNQSEFVSPIQKLSIENTQPKVTERNIHYEIAERKQNLDQNRNLGQGHLFLHSQAPPTKNINLQLNTQLLSQETVNVLSSTQDQSLGSFRPHSSKPVTQSLQPKDWRSVIETVELERNSSRGNLQSNGIAPRTLQEDKKFTGKILSPEEIKAMMGRRAHTQKETQQLQTRAIGVQRIEAVRHAEVPNHQTMLGGNMELKHSYYDHGTGVQLPPSLEHKVRSFSPEFNNLHQEQHSLQTEPVEINVFRPIETLHTEQSSTTNTVTYDQSNFERNRPTEPYQFRYVSQSQAASGSLRPLSVNDLRPPGDASRY